MPRSLRKGNLSCSFSECETDEFRPKLRQVNLLRLYIHVNPPGSSLFGGELVGEKSTEASEKQNS